MWQHSKHQRQKFAACDACYISGPNLICLPPQPHSTLSTPSIYFLCPCAGKCYITSPGAVFRDTSIPRTSSKYQPTSHKHEFVLGRSEPNYPWQHPWYTSGTPQAQMCSFGPRQPKTCSPCPESQNPLPSASGPRHIMLRWGA